MENFYCPSFKRKLFFVSISLHRLCNVSNIFSVAGWAVMRGLVTSSSQSALLSQSGLNILGGIDTILLTGRLLSDLIPLYVLDLLSQPSDSQHQPS